MNDEPFPTVQPLRTAPPSAQRRRPTVLVGASPSQRQEAVGLGPAKPTESQGDTAHLTNILRFYREAGFRVALDDLGSGYASLNRLSELRPDYVKLDMQLIRGVDQDPFKATIADRLLSMARDLGVQTVMEGVETVNELRWAQDHRADFVQGYLLARPGNPPLKPNWPAAAK